MRTIKVKKTLPPDSAFINTVIVAEHGYESMSTLQYAVQSYVLYLIESYTGKDNPLHTLVTQVVIVLVSFFTGHGPSWFEHSKTWWTAAAKPDTPTNHLRIPRLDSFPFEGSRTNLYYDSFKWFISELRPCCGGKMVASQYLDARIVPETGVTHSFEWDENNFQYSFMTTETKRGDDINVQHDVSLTCDNPDALLKFPKQIYKLYSDSLSKQSWQQRLHTHTRRPGRYLWQNLSTQLLFRDDP